MNNVTTNSACPSEPELLDFSRVGLAPEKMDDVQSHVENCSKCILFLDQQEDSDTVVRTLTSLSATVDDEIEFQRLQQNLLNDPQPIDTETWVRQISNAKPRTDPRRLIGQVIDDYELLDLLGSGANGAVFRAKHQRLGREFALKLLSATERRPESIEDFRREMKAVGQLNHKNIIHATDAGEANGRYYLVMELLEGVDLSKLLRRIGPLSIADATRIIQLAANGLHYAHEEGMIHRDVKPSNLFFEFAGNIRLLDLGLVSWGELTSDEESSVARGTADYMSPEQWQDFQHVDRQGDIYSLGCALFKLLVGKAPFAEAIGSEAKMSAHLFSEFPSVRLVRDDMPLGLDRILRRMTSKNPRDRFETMQQVSETLHNYAVDADLTRLKYRYTGEPGPAELQTESSQPRKRVVTRQRFLWGTLAACTLFMLGNFLLPTADTTRPPTWLQLTNESPLTLSLDSSAQVTAMGDSGIEVTASDSTIVRLGRPIHGEFQLETTIDQLPEESAAGLAFRYRKSKPEIGIQHDFQSIVAKVQDGSLELLWRDFHWLMKRKAPELKEEFWAKTIVRGVDPESPITLSLTLGTNPFPIVSVNGSAIDEQHWTISRAAKSATEMRSENLRRQYLGEVGLFGVGTEIVFTDTRLKYFETAK